jgi:hypothetical protein
MLKRLNTNTRLPGQEEAVRPIIGTNLARRLKGISKDFRALLAYELATGAADFFFPTRKQAAALMEVSLRYVAAVAKLSPEQRVQVKRKQLTLSAVVNRRKPAPVTDINTIIDKLTNADIDTIVTTRPDAVMAALDRATAPANDNAATLLAAE